MSDLYLVRITNMNMPIEEELIQKMPEGRAERISRFRQHGDKLRCLTAGLLAKRAAADYAGCSMEAVRVVTQQGHAPYAVYQEKKIYMSISHAGNYVLCMTDSSECGADVERVKFDDEYAKIAQHYFCQEEFLTIQTADTPEEQADCFFKIWTMKEAYLKLLGVGLRKSLNSFSVSEVQKQIKIFDSDAETQDLFCKTLLYDSYRISAVSKNPDFCLQIYDSQKLFEFI